MQKKHTEWILSFSTCGIIWFMLKRAIKYISLVMFDIYRYTDTHKYIKCCYEVQTLDSNELKAMLIITFL